jgi:ELWxxDGT repeat protein
MGFPRDGVRWKRRPLHRRTGFPPTVEALERRVLMSQTPTLLKDINRSPLSSSPEEAVVMGGVSYFSADDAVHGRELWRSDGTAAGTYLVKDINPAGGSDPVRLTAVGSTLYFLAIDALHGRELWKSDGTAAGTVRVKDIRPGPVGAFPGDQYSGGPLIVVNGRLVFAADDGVHGEELWVSNGTATGTKLLKDIDPGSASSLPVYGPGSWAVVGNKAFFTANDGSGTGGQLWATDGTPGGTYKVTDVNPTQPTSSLSDLTAAGNLLFFLGNDSVHGRELWRSDGTVAGTSLVKDIYPGPTGSSPISLTVVGNTLFFLASDPDHGQELWKSDGTGAGTVLVKDINPGTAGSGVNPYELVNFNGVLLFVANDGSHGIELWRSDGSEPGTYLVQDIKANGSSYPAELTVAGSLLYFIADDGVHGYELWKSDGTGPGTVLVADVTPGSQGTFIETMVTMNGLLYFSALLPPYTQESLWRSDGTPGGTVLVADSGVGLTGIVAGRDTAHGMELWRSDGSTAGTSLLKDINPAGASLPLELTNVAGWLYFSADDGVHRRELWQSDGTTVGTVLVKNIRLEGSSNPEHLAAVGDTLYFTADDGVHGQEPWVLRGVTPPGVPLPEVGVAAGLPGVAVGGEEAGHGWGHGRASAFPVRGRDETLVAAFAHSLAEGAGGPGHPLHRRAELDLWFALFSS